MYRKKGREWTKHVDFMLLDILCIQLAFIAAYIFRFGTGNPYMDRDYRIFGIAFLLIDFFVEIVSDSFKNVLKRGCRIVCGWNIYIFHVMAQLVFFYPY